MLLDILLTTISALNNDSFLYTKRTKFFRLCTTPERTKEAIHNGHNRSNSRRRKLVVKDEQPTTNIDIKYYVARRCVPVVINSLISCCIKIRNG